MRITTLSFFVLLTLALCGSSFAAEGTTDPDQIAGKFHLGTQYTVLGYRVTGYQNIDDVETRHVLGLFSSYDQVNLQLGGGITDHYYFGGNLEVGLTEDKERDIYFQISILNRYVFDGLKKGIASIRPFIGAAIKYSYWENSERKVDDHFLGLGVQGGMHVFLGRYFSLDVLAEAGYEFGIIDYSWFGFESDFSDIFNNPPEIGYITDSGYSHSGYLKGSLGISLWI